MSAKYIISKFVSVPQCSRRTVLTLQRRGIDPFFAISCGVIAAGVRINREEKEKGQTTQQTIDSFRRRWALVWERENGEKVKG